MSTTYPLHVAAKEGDARTTYWGGAPPFTRGSPHSEGFQGSGSHGLSLARSAVFPRPCDSRAALCPHGAGLRRGPSQDPSSQRPRRHPSTTAAASAALRMPPRRTNQASKSSVFEVCPTSSNGVQHMNVPRASRRILKARCRSLSVLVRLHDLVHLVVVALVWVCFETSRLAVASLQSGRIGQDLATNLDVQARRRATCNYRPWGSRSQYVSFVGGSGRSGSTMSCNSENEARADANTTLNNETTTPSHQKSHFSC